MVVWGLHGASWVSRYQYQWGCKSLAKCYNAANRVIAKVLLVTTFAILAYACPSKYVCRQRFAGLVVSCFTFEVNSCGGLVPWTPHTSIVDMGVVPNVLVKKGPLGIHFLKRGS